jgi:hypothetical protein
MAQTMAMGQAAGTAAALAVGASDDDPRRVAVPQLRDRLRADGAVLELARDSADATRRVGQKAEVPA